MFSLKKYFIYFIFRQRRREGEREGEKYQCVVASHLPCSEDLAHNPRMCPDWELSPLPCGLEAGAQSTEPYQPGPKCFLFHKQTWPPVNHCIFSVLPPYNGIKFLLSIPTTLPSLRPSAHHFPSLLQITI